MCELVYLSRVVLGKESCSCVCGDPQSCCVRTLLGCVRGLVLGIVSRYERLMNTKVLLEYLNLLEITIDVNL